MQRAVRENFRFDQSSRSFFESPQPAGRKILTGFTYLQRIGKAASFDVWFPLSLRAELEARLVSGKKIGAEQFPAEWAAVRQFELLQESGNHKIYDLDPSNFERAVLDLSRSMRAGGYRLMVATLGCYEEKNSSDELEIFDLHLQERIAQMIHMLYLDEPSEEINREKDGKLAAHQWDYRHDLPHISMVLGAGELYQRKGVPLELRHAYARQFFTILNELPQNHIVHDTAIGLQLPELNGENQWNYIASPDETLAAFNHVLSSVYDKFNNISLSGLQGGEGGAVAEIKASVLHMRGYGDHMSAGADSLLRPMALAFH